MAIEVITVKVNDLKDFRPAHVGTGDMEFFGHGPRVQMLTRLSIVAGELIATTWMRALETKADWTEATAETTYTLYSRPGVTVLNVLSDMVSEISYTDSNVHDDTITPPEGGLIQKMICTGDTVGNDVDPVNADSKTKMSLFFNSIKLLVDTGVNPPETINPPNSNFFVPPHTGGDKDFWGHGPEVNVSVNIWIDPALPQNLMCTIEMKARETKADWTEADGIYEYTLYTHPTGAIQSIVTDDASSLHYVDTNVQPDVFERGPGDLVKKYFCVGDTVGNDAGDRTGVSVEFNSIKIIPV